MIEWLDGAQAAGLEHAELEDQLDAAGRGLLRQLFQDHLDLRAQRETRVAVVDADGQAHRAVETGHARALATVFGAVDVARLAYRRRGHPNLHPADAALNLPAERHSHGLRRLAAVEASRGSFDGAVDAIERSTGQTLGKTPGRAAGGPSGGRLRRLLHRPATTAGRPRRRAGRVL